MSYFISAETSYNIPKSQLSFREGSAYEDTIVSARSFMGGKTTLIDIPAQGLGPKNAFHDEKRACQVV